jgi:hypothetical protein
MLVLVAGVDVILHLSLPVVSNNASQKDYKPFNVLH